MLIRSPFDIDLWSGGVSERSNQGSVVGPTFSCIIASQFSALKRGDRFWYEFPDQPSSFTPGMWCASKAGATGFTDYAAVRLEQC